MPLRYSTAQSITSPHPATGDRFPVIQVPGGHKVPVQAIKGSPDQRTLINGKYYIRRQGPQSAEPATAEEWRDLVMRCVRTGRDDLLDAIRDVLAGHVPEATSAPTVLEDLQEWANAGIDKWRSLVPSDQYGNPALPPGFYCVAYAIDGSFERPSLVELSSILKLSTVHHTGWPAWWLPSTPDMEPQPIDGMLECDMGVTSGRLISDPPHADFWRASPEGRLLLIRGLLEDDPDDFEPGQIFSLTTPIWRAGECLLHAAAVATNLGAPEATVVFIMRWSGLRGRELHDVERRRDIRGGRIAQQDEIELSITVPAGSIDDALPEMVYELLRPLFELFSLFELPRFLVEEELRKMRAHRF